jgi:hypothetical protein
MSRAMRAHSRDVVVFRLARVLEAADVQREQLRLGDFVGHPDQLLLHNLVAGDGLVAELLAEFGVLQGSVVAGHGRADGSPTDAVAGLVEAHEGALDSLCAGHDGREGHMHVLQREAAGVGGAQAPLAVNIVRGEAGAIGFDQETTDLAPFVLILGKDHGHVGDGS